MSMFQVGDTVRVKMDIIETVDSPGITRSMRPYQGQHVTIGHAFLNFRDNQRYYIKEDRYTHAWCDDFFELIDTSEKPYEYW